MLYLEMEVPTKCGYQYLLNCGVCLASKMVNLQIVVTVLANKFSLICVTAYYMQCNDLLHAKLREVLPYLEILTFHFWGQNLSFPFAAFALSF